MTRNPLGVLASPAEWRAALDSLPDLTATKGRIPSFFCKSRPHLVDLVPNYRVADSVDAGPELHSRTWQYVVPCDLVWHKSYSTESLVTGPILLWPPGEPNSREGMFGQVSAPDGLLVQFLRDFGKTLLTK